eukprot:CAMPEP_0172307946 /NCGR_PEP_ID=MMETSP1058-20130122/8691_1 /TAXON_ID=83371 /ORGANISM="Detonula confervacea, Strain CCMP 353" /LENGTH=347 /DNA_ID=CAMNT_0013020263 /DNA_START=191 /DNA_END=1234 /DNA_ORIENTATION=+
MSSKLPQSPECKFGTFLLQRNIPSSSTEKQPPLRIAYRIIRPSLLKLQPKQEDQHSPAPLIVIHGGPSLPSEYLTPLAHSHHLKNRTIIFWDQLGCGWSSIPQQDEWYGVLQMSQDLEALVWHLKDVWKLEHFHLLGHSLGGAIGYEFLKRQIVKSREGSREKDMPQCLSYILSNSSTNFQLSSSEQNRLFQEFQLQHLQSRMPSKQQQAKKLNIKDQFFQTHICRTSTKPTELVSALSRRGKKWSANEYTAMPLANDTSVDTDTATAADKVGTNQFPPVLIIRGQFDFVTEVCTRDWKDLFSSQLKDSQHEPKEVVMEDCAHYPHFEQPDNYSFRVENFCSMAEPL